MNILFTGASSGFGKHVYGRLKGQGHVMVGLGLGGPDMQYDFSEPDLPEMESWCTSFMQELNVLGKFPDTLVLNAGVTKIDFLERQGLEDFDHVMRVNLYTPFLLTQAWMRERRRREINTPGRCVVTTTMGTTFALRGSSAYCASKAGLEMMVKVWAKEYAGKTPVTFLCVAPGGVDGTKMVEDVIEGLMRTRGMTREEAEKYNRQSPLGRNMTFEELWKVYDFAINQAPEYMSGSVLKMSGAMGV